MSHLHTSSVLPDRGAGENIHAQDNVTLQALQTARTLTPTALCDIRPPHVRREQAPSADFV